VGARASTAAVRVMYEVLCQGKGRGYLL
jgi:hypothetical protein